jgi:hypothetical protein
MDTGPLLALGFAAVVIVLAIVLGRLLRRNGRDKNDINGSDRDNRANATWIGIREAGRDHDPTS